MFLPPAESPVSTTRRARVHLILWLSKPSGCSSHHRRFHNNASPELVIYLILPKTEDAHVGLSPWQGFYGKARSGFGWGDGAITVAFVNEESRTVS